MSSQKTMLDGRELTAAELVQTRRQLTRLSSIDIISDKMRSRDLLAGVARQD
jgi:hypothetical protein